MISIRVHGKECSNYLQKLEKLLSGEFQLEEDMVEITFPDSETPMEDKIFVSLSGLPSKAETAEGFLKEKITEVFGNKKVVFYN